jgi:hypothetical protein
MWFVRCRSKFQRNRLRLCSGCKSFPAFIYGVRANTMSTPNLATKRTHYTFYCRENSLEMNASSGIRSHRSVRQYSSVWVVAFVRNYLGINIWVVRWGRLVRPCWRSVGGEAPTDDTVYIFTITYTYFTTSIILKCFSSSTCCYFLTFSSQLPSSIYFWIFVIYILFILIVVREFSFIRNVQTSPRANPVSFLMYTGVPSGG